MFQFAYNCKTVTRLISNSLDTRLPLLQDIRVKLHLLRCKFCYRYQKQLLAIREIFQYQIPNMSLFKFDSKLTQNTKKRLKDVILNKKERQ